MRGVQRFTDLRAWQACTVYKKAIYRLIERGVYGNDWKRRGQLEESVAGPPDHIAEGFGRFNPPDFARFTVMARASLMESQSQLHDPVDKRYITEETRLQLDALAGRRSKKSPASWNISNRRRRCGTHAGRGSGVSRRGPSAWRSGRRGANLEPRTTNKEPRTAKPEPRTQN